MPLEPVIGKAFGPPDTANEDETSAKALAHACHAGGLLCDHILSSVADATSRAKTYAVGSARRFEAEQDQAQRDVQRFRREMSRLRREGANARQIAAAVDLHRQVSSLAHEERLRRLDLEGLHLSQRVDGDRATMVGLASASRGVASIGQAVALGHQTFLDGIGLSAAIDRDLKKDVAVQRQGAQANELKALRIKVRQREAANLGEERRQALCLERLRLDRREGLEVARQSLAAEQSAHSERAARRAGEARFDLERLSRARDHRMKQQDQDVQHTRQLVGTVTAVGQAIAGTFGKKG